MYSVAIIDTSPEQANDIICLLQSSLAGQALDIKSFVGSKAFCALVHNGFVPDIAFIDICPDGNDDEPTGIELAQGLAARGVCPQVIFMSSLDDYHTSVYRTKHTAYLKKPCSGQAVREALALALANLSRREDERPLTLRFGKVERPVYPRSISYVESRLRKASFHVAGEVGETYVKLGDLEGILPPWFVRCHQSFLVNLDYLIGFQGSDAVLLTGERVPMSRRYRRSMQEALLEHVRRSTR